MQTKPTFIKVKGSHSQSDVKYLPTMEDLKKIPVEVAATLVKEFVSISEQNLLKYTSEHEKWLQQEQLYKQQIKQILIQKPPQRFSDFTDRDVRTKLHQLEIQNQQFARQLKEAEQQNQKQQLAKQEQEKLNANLIKTLESKNSKLKKMESDLAEQYAIVQKDGSTEILLNEIQSLKQQLEAQKEKTQQQNESSMKKSQPSQINANLDAVNKVNIQLKQFEISLQEAKRTNENLKNKEKSYEIKIAELYEQIANSDNQVRLLQDKINSKNQNQQQDSQNQKLVVSQQNEIQDLIKKSIALEKELVRKNSEFQVNQNKYDAKLLDMNKKNSQIINQLDEEQKKSQQMLIDYEQLLQTIEQLNQSKQSVSEDKNLNQPRTIQQNDIKQEFEQHEKVQQNDENKQIMQDFQIQFEKQQELIGQLSTELEKKKSNSKRIRTSTLTLKKTVDDIQETISQKRRHSDINQYKERQSQQQQVDQPIIEDDKESDQRSNQISSDEEISLQQLNKTINELRDQIESLNEEICEYEENQKFMQQQFNDLQKAKLEVDKYYKIAYDEVQRLSPIEDTLKEWEEKLDQQEAALNVQKEIQEEQTSDIQNYKDQVEQCLSEIEKFQQENSNLKEKIEKLQYDLNTPPMIQSQQPDDQNDSKLSFLQNKLALVEKGEKAALGEVKEAKQKYSNLEQENKNLKEKLRSLEEKQGNIEKSSLVEQKNKEELAEQLQSLSDQKKKVDQQVEKERAGRRDQLKEIETLRQQLFQEKKKSKELESKLKQIDELQQTIEEVSLT